MSISWKKTTTLVNEFLKYPNEFENYVKGCLDSISKINYLKETQLDESIDNYNYFKCLSGAIPFDISLALLNIEYRKKILEQIPNERIINVKTNVFYVDEIRDFMENMKSTFTQIPKEEKCHYSRMVVTVIVNQSELIKDNDHTCTSIEALFQKDKVYTINELISLFQKKTISIIDNHVEPDEISAEELLCGLKSDTFVFQEADLNWLGLDNKIHADFISCKNEYDRMVWHILYSNFLRYIREYKIYCSDAFDNNSSGYNLSWYFNKTIEQLEEIFSKIKSSYRKKKKVLPDYYANVIQEASYIIDKEKSRFQGTSHNKEKSKIIKM